MPALVEPGIQHAEPMLVPPEHLQQAPRRETLERLRKRLSSNVKGCDGCCGEDNCDFFALMQLLNAYERLLEFPKTLSMLEPKQICGRCLYAPDLDTIKEKYCSKGPEGGDGKWTHEFLNTATPLGDQALQKRKAQGR